MGSSDAETQAQAQQQAQQPPPQSELELAEDAGFTLVIEPPAAAKSEPVRLEHVSASDTVLSLRQLVAEYPALACYTCYHLEALSADGKTSYVSRSLRLAPPAQPRTD